MLSIVIPVYNLERFIIKCLESLENQTNSDFEAIIVNDGSTDNTLEIIEDFLKQTSLKNARLFNSSNKGVSEARNLGIRESSGDYLLFLDGDDSIQPSLVETIYNLKKKYDIIFFNHDFVDEDNYSVIKSSVNKLDKDSFSNDYFIRNHLLTTHYLHLWIGSIVFSKKFLSSLNLQFISKLQVGEDTNFISKCFLLAKEIKYIDTILSNYVQRSGSVTKRYNIRKFDSVYSYIDVANFVSENSFQIEPTYIDRIVNKFYYLPYAPM
jgi:glycosyltransferase involved in cell wall biosynthesis